jgi:hypothetical protein
MNLKDFISETLVEIAEGVQDAQERATGVNPKPSHIYTTSQTGGSNLILGLRENNDPIHMVEFDVAVTSSEGKETKGGISVVSGLISLGAQGKSQENTQSISRIKFKVPVCLPSGS